MQWKSVYIVGCNERSELHLYLRSACTLYLILTSVLRAGCCPLLFAEVRAQGQERRHGRRRRRRRYRDVPSASFRQTFCLNRGNPTQEGEQVGVAFLLVTFLWPRKEKLLAQARRAGETPSRPAASRPARRSRATTQRLLPPTPYLGTDDYAYRLIDPTIARRSRACLPQARSLAGRRDATGKGGVAAPIGPRRVPSP